MRKRCINNTAGMPPYSPSCSIDDKYVFISGQVALDPNSTEKVLVGAGDVSKEATQVLKNVSSLLKKSGASWDSALFVQIFFYSSLQSQKDFLLLTFENIFQDHLVKS